MRSTLILVKILLAAAVIALTIDLVRRSVGDAEVAQETGRQAETLGGAVSEDSLAALRRTILRHIEGPDSYLPAMLREGDSVLKRWPDRMTRPIAVFLSRGDVPGYTPELREAARRAFVRWQRVGAIPVRFTFVPDSASAEVQVVWTQRFPIRRAGQADITWRRGGWIVRARLTLATHTGDGMLLGDDAVYTVALHEIGHLLGLGHSDDPRDVMYPSTDVHDITLRDRHTGRLLYSVPPGPLGSGG